MMKIRNKWEVMRMLLQFSVSNYMSIREEIVFSMLADHTDHEHENYLIRNGSESLLPAAAIYGANAAGKTCLLRAVSAAVSTIRESSSKQVNEPLAHMIPFRLDDESRNAPTSFDFIFVANGKKYQYGFSADRTRIYEEYLYVYHTARPSKIFTRENTREYSFTKANEKEFRKYVSMNTENKLLLATATAWNCEKTREAFLWLSEGIQIYDGRNIQELGLKILEKNDAKLHDFLLSTLKNVDFNIDNFQFQAKDMPLSEMELPEELRTLLEQTKAEGKGKAYEIAANHIVYDEQNHVKKYDLPFAAESKGTQLMFFYCAIIKKAIDSGSTVLIDEIDSSLHPLLVEYIINMFYDRQLNADSAQLIFTTHDVSLLTLKLFRRDQVYFAEKDHRTGVTDIYSLSEFSPRKTENIRKGYLQGRYGAIPVMNQDDVLW